MDKILVIDDDDGILTCLSKMFSYLGYEVKVAHDGEEGIELLKNDRRFKVVITDISMPRKNGNQVAKYMRDAGEFHDTPIVALTGNPDDADRELFDSVLTKPFEMNDIVRMINTFS